MGYNPGPCRPGGTAAGQPLRAGKLHASPTKHRRPETGDTDLAATTSAVVGGVGILVFGTENYLISGRSGGNHEAS